MIFETATEKDIPQLLELIETCYRGDIAKKGWTYESDLMDGSRTTVESLKEEITAPGGQYLKYTDEQGKIVGCLYTKVIPQDNKLFLTLLCVHPTIQSQGIGKKLMAAAEDVAKKAGCSKLGCSVLTVRKELTDWYEKLGYKWIGETSPFPDGYGTPKIPLHLRAMEKQLDGIVKIPFLVSSL